MIPFPQNTIPRIWMLANSVCEGTISEQELRELESLLEADSNAKEFYLDFISINAEISWLVSAKQHGAMDLGPRSPVDALVAPPSHAPIISFLGNVTDFFNYHSPLSFVLLFMVFGATLLATTYLFTNRNTSQTHAEFVFVARITGSKDCQWSTSNEAPTEMASLEVGRKLKLEKGIVEITYSNKAQVVLEGPVSYTVDSPKSGILVKGKLFVRADSEQSRQFTIVTPNAKFVDLGTEFGVEVDNLQRSSVAVFSGNVNAAAKHTNGSWSNPVSVRRGEAVVCEGEKFTPLVAQRSNFPSMQPLPPPPPAAAYQRWLDASKNLPNNNNLVVYYDFQLDPKNPQVLVNRAPTGMIFNGEIQNAMWVQGRFSEKNALEFSNKNAGVFLNIPTEYSQMTLVAWVRIDRMENEDNGILMSDDWSQIKNLTWSIRNTGQIKLGVLGQKWKAITDRKLPDACVNRWCMLAGVITTPNKTVLYLNGEPFETLDFIDMPPIKIGSATIGGHNLVQPGKTTDKNLTGRIDELMVFQNALTAEEVKQIYESGKPENN